MCSHHVSCNPIGCQGLKAYWWRSSQVLIPGLIEVSSCGSLAKLARFWCIPVLASLSSPSLSRHAQQVASSGYFSTPQPTASSCPSCLHQHGCSEYDRMTMQPTLPTSFSATLHILAAARLGLPCLSHSVCPLLPGPDGSAPCPLFAKMVTLGVLTYLSTDNWTLPSALRVNSMWYQGA